MYTPEEEPVVQCRVAYECDCPNCGDVNTASEDEFTFDLDEEDLVPSAKIECFGCGCLFKAIKGNA